MDRYRARNTGLPVRMGDMLADLRQWVAPGAQPSRDAERVAITARPGLERVTTELRGVSRAPNGTRTEFHYIRTEQRWPGTPAARQSLLPGATGRSSIVLRRAGLLLALPAAAILFAALLPGDRTRAPSAAAPTRAPPLRIQLDEAIDRPLPPGTAEARRATRHSAAAVVPAAAGAIAATKVPPAATAAEAPTRDAAVAKALADGLVQPWSEGDREGFVIAGPAPADGGPCREITVLATGDAQGAAVSELKCASPSARQVDRRR